MSIPYIYISFINIKTCDKYDASLSVNEQINTYILTTGGGNKIQKLLIFTTILGRENTKTLFSRSFFSWGGGGEKKRRNKVLTFLLKKRPWKMTVCLARFRSKGSLIICEISNIDHVRVYNGISFIQSKTTISIMETCIYSYVYLSISNIYLSVYLYVCMHVCMYVCMYAYIYMYVCIMYISVCLSVHVYLSIVLFSFPPKNEREYKKYFLNFLSTPKVVKKSSLFSRPKNGSENKKFFIFSPKTTVVNIYIYILNFPSS